MKQLKDYIHLYLGCDVIYYDKEGNQAGFGKNTHGLHVNIQMGVTRVCSIKPILRQLSDMTEEEDQAFMLANRNHWIDMNWYPEGFLWLLSRGFDLFGLIDAGLAINAKDTNNQTN